MLRYIREGRNPAFGMSMFDTCSLYQKKLFGEERNLIDAHLIKITLNHS